MTERPDPRPPRRRAAPGRCVVASGGALPEAAPPMGEPGRGPEGTLSDSLYGTWANV